MDPSLIHSFHQQIFNSNSTQCCGSAYCVSLNDVIDAFITNQMSSTIFFCMSGRNIMRQQCWPHDWTFHALCCLIITSAITGSREIHFQKSHFGRNRISSHNITVHQYANSDLAKKDSVYCFLLTIHIYVIGMRQGSLLFPGTLSHDDEDCYLVNVFGCSVL